MLGGDVCRGDPRTTGLGGGGDELTDGWVPGDWATEGPRGLVGAGGDLVQLDRWRSSLTQSSV